MLKSKLPMVVTGATAGAAVFLLIVITTTLVQFILPETYASTARVLVRQARQDSRTEPPPPESYFVPTQVEVILSAQILIPVVDEMDLRNVLGRRFIDDKLKTEETVAVLRARLDVRQIPNTSLLTIRAYSEDRQEASNIANAVAETYQRLGPGLSPRLEVAVVDRAAPALRPSRPNKPLNITLGIIVGFGASVAVGALVFWLLWFSARQRAAALPADHPNPQPPPLSVRF
jgi:capsular polysaccharide biosynthesis protein